MDHGMPEEAFYNIECVRAVRPIGMGSPIAQQQKLEQVMALLPFLDQQAQQWLVRKKITSNLGIDYGFLVNEKPAVSPDKKIAELEANSFINGITPEISDGEDDSLHLFAEHLPFSGQTLKAADEGMEPQEALKRLSAAIPHMKMHAERLAKNPIKKQDSVKANQAIQQVEAATQKLAQNFQQSQEAEGEAQQKEQEKMTAFQMEQERLSAESQARIAREDALAQADLALKTKKTDTDIQLSQDKAQNDIEVSQAKTQHGIIDKKAKAATDIEATQALTTTDISSKARTTRAKIAATDLTTAQQLEINSKKAKDTTS